MTDQDDLRLAELLCARLCHDMAGPVGAAAAGAELLEDTGGDPETTALVAASAQGAAARLKFFRATLGPAASATQSGSALRDLAEAYLQSASSGGIPGLVLDWTAGPASLDGERARLLLNLVLLAKDALPRGGSIAVLETPGRLQVAARGDGSGLSDEAREVLVANQPPAGPRGGQALLSRRLGESLGLHLAVEASAGGVTFSAG